MRIFGRFELMAEVARSMRRQANRMPTYDGIATPENFLILDRCKAFHAPTGSLLIYTRDAGMHSSGWWKNPEYERCFHLSLSFVDPISGERAPKNDKLTLAWLEAFYGDDRRYAWAEPPYSPDGKTQEVWHYRIFCDPAWQPIIPRGEVYGRELTEAGWLSFSDRQDQKSKALARLDPQPGEQ